MRIIDTVPAYTVETGDTVSFVCTVDDEQLEEVLTVGLAFESCDELWALSGYSHIQGESVIRFVDPDLEVDIIGEL